MQRLVREKLLWELKWDKCGSTKLYQRNHPNILNTLIIFIHQPMTLRIMAKDKCCPQVRRAAFFQHAGLLVASILMYIKFYSGSIPCRILGHSFSVDRSLDKIFIINILQHRHRHKISVRTVWHVILCQ